MPIYEYKCKTCEETFEELVSSNTEGDHLTCPTCGAVGARRLVSAFAAHGLENGHIAVGRKLTGGSSAGGSSDGGDEGTKSEAAAKPAHSCGPACACH